MRVSSDVYCIDANVVLRYLAEDVPHQFLKASTILKAVERGEIAVFCDPAILSEIVWALTTHYNRTGAQIWEGLSPIVKADGFLIPDKARYIRALKLLAESVPHFGDACACAAALERCSGRLFSFDKRLSNVEGIARLEALDG